VSGYQAILFDAVGTLIYPHPPVPEVYHRIGRRYGSRKSPDQIASRFREAFWRAERLSTGPEHQATRADVMDRPPTNHQSERNRWCEIVAEVFDDVPNARGGLFADLWEHFARGRHWRVFDEVADIWERLEGRFTLGVASNFDDRLVAICHVTPPLNRCRHLFWSADVGFPKPSPEFYRLVQRRLGLEGKQILMVGNDPLNDFRGARAAGWNALLVERASSAIDGWDGVGAEQRIVDLRGLLSLLASNGAAS
jgi:putative hydrolase of the HAD superfamily